MAGITVQAAHPPTIGGSGTTYYVSNAGRDSNSGTSPSSAWKTIAKVQSFVGTLRGGDSVLFERGGIWYEALDLSDVNGSPGAPITFGNYGSRNLPIIDGGGRKVGFSLIGGRKWCMGVDGYKISYVTIDGFECRNASNYGIAFFSLLDGSVGVIVQNCYIHDTGDYDHGYHNQLMWGDYMGGYDGTKFLNNKVGNCYGHNCIEIQGDRGSPVIQGNECYGWSHNCIDVHYVQGAWIDGNVVHDGLGNETYQSAFYNANDGDFTWTSEVTWTRNLVYGFVKSTAFQCQYTGGPTTCYMFNNTVITRSNGTFGGSDTGKYDQLKFYVKNNIFDTPRPRAGSGYIEWDYNDHIQSTGIGAHDLSRVSPKYVNPAAHDYRLQPHSPVIDKGTNVNLPYSGNAPDLGAFEYVR